MENAVLSFNENINEKPIRFTFNAGGIVNARYLDRETETGKIITDLNVSRRTDGTYNVTYSGNGDMTTDTLDLIESVKTYINNKVETEITIQV